MNQASAIGFGTDAYVIAGYAQRGNERLGNVDFIFENTGTATLRVMLKQRDGTTSPSGFAAVGAAHVVVPGGNKTASYQIIAKKIGFFGSGNTATDLTGTVTSTKCNITAVLRNKADLRGAQIDIVSGGRRGWGLDEAMDHPTLTKNWGLPPDAPNEPTPTGGGGF